MNTNRINLKGLNRIELESWVRFWGEPKYRAKQLMSWIYQKGISDFESMTNLPKSFRQTLSSQASISQTEIVTNSVSADDKSIKFLFRLSDGKQVESVLMFDQQRVTACLSSQFGCAMGCQFCATGKMGFFRNLTTAEILDQFMGIQKELGREKPITNVVFMGMGEPFANYKPTMKAIRLLCSQETIGMAERRITVSTVGLAPQIRRFADEGLKCKLALSLNATTNADRSQLMPINSRFPIDEILSATKHWAQKTGELVTLEYVLIRGINDRIKDAERLCQLMANLPCKLNIIPFNEIADSNFQRPEANAIENFQQIITQNHYVAPIRFSKGSDITAACGQLRTIYHQAGKTMTGTT